MGRRLTDLPDKQRAFVGFYLSGLGTDKASGTTLCATKAARAAGYACPETVGSRLLRNPKIRAAVNEELEEIEQHTEQILGIELLIATTGVGEFADVMREYSAPAMLEKAKEMGIDYLIKKIKVDKDGGVTLEFYDAHASRKLLGERLGLFDKDAGGLDLSKLPPMVMQLAAGDPAEIRQALADFAALRAGRDD